MPAMVMKVKAKVIMAIVMLKHRPWKDEGIPALP